MSRQSTPQFTSPKGTYLPFAVAFGHACEVLVANSARSVFRLASVYSFLEPPIRLGQIRFIFNGSGTATGYVAWAFLTDEVFKEIDAGPARTLHLGEWNEGSKLVIMDVVINVGGAMQLLGEFREAVGGRPIWWRRHDRHNSASRERRIMLRAPMKP